MPEPEPPTTPDPLAAFSAPTRTWFQQRFGQPTPPQAQGWAAIQRGEHVLILAPTGSGKTLAAFLWGIDQRHRDLSQAPPAGSSRRRSAIRDSQSAIRNPKSAIPGVRLLYISPLKALNNDIERNLRVPLAGIARTAEELGLPFPEIRVAVRSGDTPRVSGDDGAPPDHHPGLYLLLRAGRALSSAVQTVIEIHTLVGTSAEFSRPQPGAPVRSPPPQPHHPAPRRPPASSAAASGSLDHRWRLSPPPNHPSASCHAR